MKKGRHRRFEEARKLKQAGPGAFDLGFGDRARSSDSSDDDSDDDDEYAALAETYSGPWPQRRRQPTGLSVTASAAPPSWSRAGSISACRASAPAQRGVRQRRPLGPLQLFDDEVVDLLTDQFDDLVA